MGRSPCCSKEGLNRGAWTATEDKILTDYINAHGDGKWRRLPKAAVESESSTGGRGSSSFSFLAKEENSPDYMMSFDVGEISHSGILDLEDMIKGDKNPDESSTQFLPPFCGQSYNLLNEELMLENWNGDGGIEANMDSNFEFSASFLESGEDWMM
ncbi:hypothetical protein JRO89_XS03G0296900 [Xanthoceras sorbifolium]|uniref:Myb-like domain-containing protein n=1 Tax=Xanthoceras sorbifolium TaxID=99658 RepID=A0ABQ8ICQ9_9ROSI|nr:hypothetical protein JRO89_XS03G0296900 [Xanthoceras sorbifolium]